MEIGSFERLAVSARRFKITKLEPKVKTLQQLRASVITAWLKTHNPREAQH